MVTNSGFSTKTNEREKLSRWITELGMKNDSVGVISSQQGWGKLGISQSILVQPLCLAGKEYEWGLGTHADSEIVLRCSKPVKIFRALVGVDHNKDSVNGAAEIRFSVWVGDRCFAESKSLNVGSQPEALAVELNGVTEFTLKVKAATTLNLAHADWVTPEVVTTDGNVIRVGLPETSIFHNSLPVSFVYGGLCSEEWFSKWGIKHTTEEMPDSVKHHYSCNDADTGLQFTMTMREYRDLPACYWNISFKNNSSTTSPILEKIKVLDLSQTARQRMTLYRGRGGFHYEDGKMDGEAFRDNFMLVTDDLKRTKHIAMGGIGGRSSVDWMPYFNFAGDNEGVMFGIGWTGQWYANIIANDNSVMFQAGMEHIHTVLQPGETITQPSILMINWSGNDPIRGHNLLRSFITEKLSPRYDGKPVQAPATHGSWGAMPSHEHIKRIETIKEQKLPYDYYWIDAAWYGQDCPPEGDTFTSEWGMNTGNWRINSMIYPKGLREVSDAAHQAGIKFLLWFEPERAVCGTPITMEHPEYFLGERKTGMNLLLDLGNPDAWKWCTEMVAGMIESQGIDCYRQDFNFSPLPYWQENDTPDRIGISEIRHIEGLYAFHDELLRRFPHLLIDNCASGGRRLDLEMMRRSIPLWASDMQCFPDFITERNQQHVYGLSMWIPQFSFGTEVKHPGDTYHFRSTMAGGIVAHLFPSLTVPIDSDYPFQWLRDRMAEYHRAKVYFAGDFYPLLPLSDSFRDWTAMQFHRPDLNSGIIEIFRKKDSPIVRINLELQGLEPDRIYEVENADTGDKVKYSGKELMETGLAVEITQKRDSRLFFISLYNK